MLFFSEAKYFRSFMMKKASERCTLCGRKADWASAQGERSFVAEKAFAIGFCNVES